MNRRQTYLDATANPPMAWHAGSGHSMRSDGTMAQVTIGGGRVICEMDATAQEEYERVAQWLQQAIASRNDAYAALRVAQAERDTARETHQSLVAERDAAREELDDCRDALQDWQVAAGTRQRELDAVRDALVSLVDSKNEFDIMYDTGMDEAEARRIIDLAYNRQ